ncbi:sugar-phosphatase [Prauserella isguenensis]|uniref:Sugar-phosphatase n=1 Tax=Prauserella isguenensis TaxID=1470180 RepID=A0A839S1R3_9PSEU|nr:HAD-IA family hydrolase [Prauserella isguenensis]MBB3050990.1 sugar-phosphatase [Prauserella isguenensis]
MASHCQTTRPLVIGVSGPAGSGKTTLARNLATELRVPLLDLDALTTPLLDRLHGPVFTEHWLCPPHGDAVRAARYAALRSTAADVVASAGAAVLVAPFTAELTGGPAWQELTAALAPAELRMVHLRGDPELFARRRAGRGASRDTHRAADPAPVRPAVPHIGIDAELTPPQQHFRVRRALGHRTALDPGAPVFDGPFDAVLFDVDGVLADSTGSVLRCWERLARDFGIPPATVARNHGRPARALIEQVLPGDQAAAGMRHIERLEVDDAPAVSEIPGARTLLDSLPAARHALVTSGTPAIARARLDAVGITPPPVFVTADDVHTGKPDPEPYLLAARRLGVPPERCLVVEDAPAGVAAARAAGCAVIGVLGTVAPGELAAADLLVDGLDRLTASVDDAGVHLAAPEAG